HATTTHAKTGAAGKIAITPSVGITLSNVTTTATVSSGTDLNITGSFDATADQTASASTTAEGSAKAKTAAIGASVALTIANHNTVATADRDITAGGSVALRAHGSSDSGATAKASAAGAPGDASDGGQAGNGVDQQVAHERAFAATTSADNSGSGTAGAASTPAAKTSGGGVSVAAAVGINLATTTSRATIGAIHVTAGGPFVLSTSADTDAHATADGSAARGPGDASEPSDSSGGAGAPADPTTGASIGAGVAINYVRIANEAVLPQHATVDSRGATIEAVMSSEHELGASATSGAGGGAVGIAGSVAIDIENINTNASLDGTLNAGAGDVRIAAASNATSATEALPTGAGVTGVGSVGIGASVGVAVIDDKTTANLNGSLTGGHDLTLASSTTHVATVSAKTGAAGGKVAVVPSVAIAISNVTTTATVVDGNTLDPSGDFSATADQTASAHTTALGDAEGSSAAIGVSLALVIANHRVEATLLRDIDATGGVGLGAHGASGSSATARASAAGAPEGSSEGGHAGNGVDQQVAGERSFASDTSTANGGDGSGGAESTPTASTSGGGVDIAAAVTINLATSISPATIRAITGPAGARSALSTWADTDTPASIDGVLDAADGDVKIAAASNTQAETNALPSKETGGVTGAKSVGIGASVAVSILDDLTLAELPGTLNGGADIELDASTTHLATTNAKTGAAGGKVAVVPSVAIVLSNITTIATVSSGNGLDVDGAFSASADQTASAHTSAEGSAEGSSAAIGVSLALTIANHRTEATLYRDLDAGGAVSLSAHGASDSSASAVASAAGAPQDESGAGAPTQST